MSRISKEGMRFTNAQIKRFPIGCKVRVSCYSFDFVGIVTKHLYDFATGRLMVRLNNDEYHTYYVDKVKKVEEET